MTAPSFLLYGPGISGDDLANTQLSAAAGHLKSFARFRAEQSSPLTGFWYYHVTDPGYGAGTGGTRKAELFADDGTSDHFPTGAALASQTLSALATNDPDAPVTFSSPYTVTAGTLYHIVLSNTDASPNTNNFSPDFLWNDTVVESPLGGVSPRYPDTDWAHGYYLYPSGPWVPRPGYLPIMEVSYGNGTRQGMSYGEANRASGTVGEVNSSSKMVRERFTVTGTDRTVVGVGVRLLKINGTSADLVITLRDSSDTLIDTATIAASSVSTGAAPAFSSGYDSYGGAQRWVYATFATSHTLVVGSEYKVRIASSGGTYWVWTLRRLEADYLYSTASAFTDGYAEKTTNGTVWSSLGNNANQNDIGFYLLLAAAPTSRPTLALTQDGDPVIPLTMYRGDSLILDGAFEDSLGDPYDLTNCKVWMTAKSATSDLDAGAVFQKVSPASGVTVTDESGGLVTIELQPVDTTGVQRTSTLYYDIQIEDASGRIWTVAYSTLTVTDDITRAIV